jgi:membrane-associated protein
MFMINFVLKIDQYLEMIIKDYGVLTYLILFLIIFCETGLIVTPILPGDSLLFVAGAIASRGLLDVRLLILLIAVAAIIGDMTNYAVGRFFGVRLFKNQSRFLKKEYIEKTHKIFEKYGNKAIVICRFVPIVRTFTPFVAGFGQMNYGKFMLYNVLGGLSWALIFLLGGYYFGEIPVIKKSLTLTIIGIVLLSMVPMFVEIVKARRASREI